MHLFQVSVTLGDPKTRRREIDALTTAMQELHLKTGTIVTLEDEEEIKTSAGIIRLFLR